MKQGAWEKRTHAAITAAYEQFTDTTGRLPSPNLSDKEKALCFKIVRGFYPFGQRRHFPYKVWCREVAKVREFLYGRPQCPLGGLFALQDKQVSEEPQ